MAINTGNFQDALEPIAIKNFEVGFKEIPAERDMLFDVQPSDKLIETYLETGDIGAMGEFDGDLEFEDVSQGYKMTIENVEYAKGMKIQRKFARTDQLNVVRDLPRLLGLSARRLFANKTFAPFNNAFNTTLTTLDALQLCSSAHTSTNGGSNQSNRGTSALSEANVDAARIAMKGFLTNTDQKMEVNPRMLIVPRALEQTAWEIINSSGKVETANNNANFHKGRYELLVSDWLEDDNNWFLVDSELMKMFLIWQNVDALEFGQDENFNGFEAKYRAYTFFGFGSRDWRWIYGNEVS